jgi:hypothetical protein
MTAIAIVGGCTMPQRVHVRLCTSRVVDVRDARLCVT